MSDNMARSIASDKSDPATWPEDSGLRECRQCGEDVKTEQDVEEFSHCFEHLSTVEDLKEECFYKVRDIEWLKKRVEELESKLSSSRRQFDGIAQAASDCLERNKAWKE